ncbi:electron transfer flavoprotein subunit beta/FixA family protein [Clostridium sp.]|uniref:electron transfer flavoprotein subunit beta/FixA family protein n=1 Tax=Clostridium sp. TaxID=1506 RepID=UPI001A55A836|nr:electron transfer flavoprotein subunit beta/FixA family protein [Clostridium sp.]MBK5243148.1 electron transfer flavoprotein subunit beta/FixA family protein [Clostridium sp.]
MKIIVLIKQVPDMEKVKFDSGRGVVDRTSAGTEINPFDLNALEAAVQIKEDMGAEVIAISMGPASAESALREAISRGADRGILLSDRKFGGSDCKATAYTLAAGIKNIGEFDLILAGMQTVDGDTGQIGPEIAEFLDIPHICFVEKINEINKENITLVTDIWDGIYIKKMRLPGLLTVTKDINYPRLPAFKDKMKARKAEITTWGLEELKDNLDESSTGIKGSGTVVKKIEVPAAVHREGKLWRDNLDDAMDEFLDIMIEEKVLEVR